MLRVYHGSPTQGLDTLTADMPMESRVYQNAASSLGVWSTPNRSTTESYAYNPAGRGTGAIYSADVNLVNPHVMDSGDLRPFASTGAEMQQLADEFKGQTRRARTRRHPRHA